MLFASPLAPSVPSPSYLPPISGASSSHLPLTQSGRQQDLADELFCAACHHSPPLLHERAWLLSSAPSDFVIASLMVCTECCTGSMHTGSITALTLVWGHQQLSQALLLQRECFFHFRCQVLCNCAVMVASRAPVVRGWQRPGRREGGREVVRSLAVSLTLPASLTPACQQFPLLKAALASASAFANKYCPF